MDRNDLLRAKAEKVAEARAILAKESLTEAEETKSRELLVEAKKIEDRIAALDEANRLNPTAPVDTVPATPKSPAKPFASLGEQMVAVANAARPNLAIDQRLYQVQNAATGLSSGVPSDGGFLVQTDFSTALLDRSYETGILAKLVQRLPLSTNANGMTVNGVDESSRATGSRYGGIRVYWEDEADTIQGSKPKFRQLTLKLKRLTGACYATDDVLQDAAALGAIISRQFPEEMGFALDDAILNGDGSGKPKGILASNALVTVSKESEQAADTLKAENIIKLWGRMPFRNRKNAIWAINQEAESQLFGMTIGTQPVYLPPGGLSGAQFGTLFGRPVVPMEQCAALGDKGDIVLLDPSEYITIDKEGIQAASSIHVEFLTAQQVFRFIYRVDGQPTWDTSLTPFKGANKVSPYITLEAR